MIMFMVVLMSPMVMMMSMLVPVRMRMGVRMLIMVFVLRTRLVVVMPAFLFQMDIEFGAGDLRALLARGVEMIAGCTELLQAVFELMKIHAEVDHCSDEHVAADAAENIEVKSLHQEWMGNGPYFSGAVFESDYCFGLAGSLSCCPKLQMRTRRAR